jgi:hypothetical protein
MIGCTVPQQRWGCVGWAPFPSRWPHCLQCSHLTPAACRLRTQMKPFTSSLARRPSGHRARMARGPCAASPCCCLARAHQFPPRPLAILCPNPFPIGRGAPLYGPALCMCDAPNDKCESKCRLFQHKHACQTWPPTLAHMAPKRDLAPRAVPGRPGRPSLGACQAPPGFSRPLRCSDSLHRWAGQRRAAPPFALPVSAPPVRASAAPAAALRR